MLASRLARMWILINSRLYTVSQESGTDYVFPEFLIGTDSPKSKSAMRSFSSTLVGTARIRDPRGLYETECRHFKLPSGCQVHCQVYGRICEEIHSWF